MGAVTGDILAILDKIPIWKRVQQAPARLDELERRMADLEARLARAPGEACPKCGALAMRLSRQGRSEGGGLMERRRDIYACGECAHEEERLKMLVANVPK